MRLVLVLDSPDPADTAIQLQNARRQMLDASKDELTTWEPGERGNVLDFRGNPTGQWFTADEQDLIITPRFKPDGMYDEMRDLHTGGYTELHIFSEDGHYDVHLKTTDAQRAHILAYLSETGDE